MVIYSSDAESDRAFFRDVLGFPYVDAGHGWLIFQLPPGEAAFHPAESPGHELYLMTDDIADFVADMNERGISCSELDTERWGTITRITLPGGGCLGVYQPSHPSPLG